MKDVQIVLSVQAIKTFVTPSESIIRSSMFWNSKLSWTKQDMFS